jgi:Kef-type K+ transport system membrane component KefB
VIRAALLLAVLVTLVFGARSFLPQETPAIGLVGSGATLAFGFVLLAALQSGTLFHGLRMPRLTGYLVCGFLAGPSVANLVTERMVADLKLVNGVAIGLIALSAGGELNFRRVGGRLGAIVATGGGALAMAIAILSVVVLACSPLLAFFGGMGWTQRAVVALTMGVVFSALSPTVVLALLSETGSAGPISEMSLGIVVVGDLVIVVAFAAVNALASATFGGADAGGLGGLLWHIFGSIGVGLVFGLVLLVYLKLVNARVALFVFGMCFLCAEAGTRLHIDPLLVCLTAGLFLENLTDIEGSKLVHEILPAAMPTFAVFFAVAGAGLHWEVFRAVAPVAVGLVVARGVALFVGGRAGMRVARVPREERRWLHFALYSQSGIAIGLSVLLRERFPGWGEGASACLLGGIMVNELVGPPLFKAALSRSGEAGRRPQPDGAVAPH